MAAVAVLRTITLLPILPEMEAAAAELPAERNLRVEEVVEVEDTGEEPQVRERQDRGMTGRGAFMLGIRAVAAEPARQVAQIQPTAVRVSFVRS